MAFEQRDLSGSLFKNKRRTQQNHPDYTGQAKIGGVEYWVSAWLKEKSDGEKYMSLAYTPKDTQSTAHHGNPPNKTSGLDDIDDDMPF